MISIDELNKINTETLKVLINTGMISKEDLFTTKPEVTADTTGYVDIKQVVNILDYKSDQSVYNLRNSGVLKSVILNGKNYWKLDDVLAFKNKHAAEISKPVSKTPVNNLNKTVYEVSVDAYPDEYWTADQVSEYLGYKKQFLSTLKKKGLKSYMVRNNSKTTFFVPEEVKEFARKNGFMRKPTVDHPLIINNAKVKTLNEYEKWARELKNMTTKAGVDFGKACSECFKSINKVYGINLEQSKHSYYKDKGSYPASSLRTMYYVQYEQVHRANEHYENLFENEMYKYIETHK